MVDWLIDRKEQSLSKLPNRAHVLVFLFLRATHTWRKIHCQGRPFKQHMGRDFDILQFLNASKCIFPQEVFLYRIYMKLVCCKAKILNVKSPVPTFLSFPKPFSLRPTKMFISAKTWILFWRLNSVWEKFLSPMDLTECARFRNLPSFQSGAMRRPYCALYLEIYVVELVQSARLGVGQANKLGRCLCLDKSKSLIYTGGHDSYVLVRTFDWKLIRSRNQTYTVWVTIVGQARGAVFEIARFSNKEKNQRLQLWTGEVEKNNKQIPIEEKIRKFLSFGFILSAL